MMRYGTYYLQLCDLFSTEDLIEVPLTRLAEEWKITTRYAKKIIQELHKQQIIEWTPGRGRGNLSKLRLLYDKHEVVIGLAKEHVRKRKIQEAFSVIQTHAPEVKENFVDWLSDPSL
ncbi:SgrR family transcriptional regulator [Pseudalkalibacillus berkeleyi]|uniref:SgrR family transcriptional regulator n=1 Tax=Pseudalkalibacillus berkeleyi TaxID=1069813 RepID=A0ABS9H0T4_9BACL|nr:SgrR family transcriptional regulator [Pseudalkalibacillus berkeleyi]MCF6138613.1 SgrR family transcriptional regulator [Pseudalkalibacillus berkeleyi]